MTVGVREIPLDLAKGSASTKNRLLGAILFTLGLGLISLALVCYQAALVFQLPIWLSIGFAPLTFKADSLAAFFLLLLGTITCCCAIYSPAYLAHKDKAISSAHYWTGVFVFVTGMLGVILAANAMVFLFMWELMSLSSAALVASELRQHQAQKAALIYLVATRVATAFLIAGFVMASVMAGTLSFDGWHFDSSHSWIAAALILIGLIIKAGIWPFHIWLPYAHPEAPSPVSAMMSGVMVKVSVYTALRLLVFGDLNAQFIIYSLFALATISAFWGILFAVNQRDLKRLLAYSTVENVGLIFMGVSLCLWARALHLELLADMALLSVLLHTMAHGLFKSLLFLSAGCVDYSAHSREFASLGGLSQKLPYTTACFTIGSVAICSIPPFNGFFSKWCLLQTLFQSALQMPGIANKAICMATIGLLACVGALTVACFAKAVGVGFLGRPRASALRSAKEVPVSMLVPQGILSVMCVLSGLASPLIPQQLLPIRQLLSGSHTVASQEVPIALPLPQMGFFLVLTLGAIYAAILRQQPDRFRTWDCGFGKSNSKAQVTAESFAQPIARIFTPVLRHSLHVDIEGKDRRHFPEHITAEPSMISLLETRLYGPALAALKHGSHLLGKLHAGSIHLYLLYVCLTLVLMVIAGIELW